MIVRRCGHGREGAREEQRLSGGPQGSTTSRGTATTYINIAGRGQSWGATGSAPLPSQGLQQRFSAPTLEPTLLPGPATAPAERLVLHPEFLALCGHYYLEPVACARRDPESKGIVEAGVRYVKHNALQGRAEQLTGWQDYQHLASHWRDQVANVRVHQSTRQRPIDRFEQERPCLRKLPGLRFDTDEIVSAIVSSHARVQFDGNRYSTPPEVVGKSVILRADTEQLRLFDEGQQIATHQRCYGRGQLIRQAEHQLQARQQRRRAGARQLETTFDALGEAARQFHLKLQTRPVKTGCHLRRLINLAHLYGRDDVLAAIGQALQYQTYDAAYVEALLLQERRRRELPSPTPLRPRRQELMDETDFPEPDPAAYDRLLTTAQESEEQTDDEHCRGAASETDGGIVGAETDADR